MDQKFISWYMLEQNELFHQQRQDYGTYGRKWAKGVAALYGIIGSKSVLDYGAGKRSLEKELNIPVQSYDPAIPEISKPPEPADLMVCTHVLEHIEPELLDTVLSHIKGLTRKAFLIVVDPGPSNKILPDGRDSNLIQKPIDWWITILHDRFPEFKIQNINRLQFIKHQKIISENSDKKGTFIG